MKFSHPYINPVIKIFKEFEEENEEYKLYVVTNTVQDSLDYQFTEKKDEKFSNKELADFTYQLATALNYLHTREYIMGYGQLDTKNIYIYLETLSLDIQFSNNSKLTVDDLFIPPEYNSKIVNTKEGDVFSLGLVFFQMMTLINRKTLHDLLIRSDFEDCVHATFKQFVRISYLTL